MKVDLSKDEIGVILSALERMEDRYEAFCEEPNHLLEGAAEEALEDIRSAKEKFGSIKRAGSSPKAEDESDLEGDGFLYIYVPDGIRDQELERELASRIPETSDPTVDGFFWSEKFNNFVVKAEYADEAKEAIRERYNGEVVLNEGPSWAKKEKTWQIVRKERAESSGEPREGSKGANFRPL